VSLLGEVLMPGSPSKLEDLRDHVLMTVGMLHCVLIFTLIGNNIFCVFCLFCLKRKCALKAFGVL
jgi:hypothetical protein